MNQMSFFMPPPINWQDFQSLLKEIATVKYDGNSVQEFGRSGQSQNGVDIYAVDYSDNKIGIQAKETKVNAVTKQVIYSELEKAKLFTPKLDIFIIATTQRIDKNLQEVINTINSEKTYSYKVQIWFWDDINEDINRSISVLSSYYKEFQRQFGQDEINNHLSTLRIAFDRPAFKDNFLHERNYDDFEYALVSTKQMIRTGFLYDTYGELIASTVPSDMIGEKTYKNFIISIEKKVEKLYQKYLKDKKATTVTPSILHESAGIYNIERRKVLNLLNKKFKIASMQDIDMAY